METANDKINLKGFLIDFFGVLVPGLLFIIFSLLTLGWPIILFIQSFQKRIFNSTISFDAVKEISSFSTIVVLELSLLILMASYIVGTIFFHKDPKEPDEHSYGKCLKSESIKDPESWVVQKDSEGKTDVQFPYRYLHEYLSARELFHLADLVPWKGKEPETYTRRTKIFINTLKTRLEFLFPEKYSGIIKNEAQIRLVSSLWYVTNSLILFSYIGISLLLLCLILFAIKYFQLDSNILLSSITTIFTLINSYLARNNIHKFFHYMRVREVVIVLENVYVASKSKPEILEGIIKPARRTQVL
jgi:hypothetical protein